LLVFFENAGLDVQAAGHHSSVSTFEHFQQVWRILWYFAADSWVNDQPVGFENVVGVIGTLFFSKALAASRS